MARWDDLTDDQYGGIAAQYNPGYVAQCPRFVLNHLYWLGQQRGRQKAHEAIESAWPSHYDDAYCGYPDRAEGAERACREIAAALGIELERGEK
jgi:hypothetical protein